MTAEILLSRPLPFYFRDHDHDYDRYSATSPNNATNIRYHGRVHGRVLGVDRVRTYRRQIIKYDAAKKIARKIVKLLDAEDRVWSAVKHIKGISEFVTRLMDPTSTVWDMKRTKAESACISMFLRGQST
jgi:hypothetical protein